MLCLNAAQRLGPCTRPMLPLPEAWQGSQVHPGHVWPVPGLASPARAQDQLPDSYSLGQLSADVSRGHRTASWSTQHVSEALASAMRAPQLWLNLLPVSSPQEINSRDFINAR